jgi:hypothetical protein
LGKISRGGHIFSFEKDGFENLVIDSWNSDCPLFDPVDRWQYNMRNLRRKIRGWSRNIDAEMRKNKSQILAELDLLDGKVEQNIIFDQDLVRRTNLREEIEQI